MEMNKEQSEGSPADQQQWEVFLYVSGELSDDQELAFEKRLETDQELREQVASMTGGLGRIRESLVQSERPVPAASTAEAESSPEPSELLRLIAIAAAILIGGLAFALMAQQPETPTDTNEAIALIWAESLGEADENELAEWSNDGFEYDELDKNDLDENDWIFDALQASEEG